MTLLGWHRLLVRLPIGVLLAATAFDVLSRLAPEPYTFTRPGRWVLGLGLLAALAVGVPALVAVTRSPRPDAVLHVAAVDLALVGYTASLALRWNDATDIPLRPLPLVLSLAAAAGLGAGVVLGASLHPRPDAPPS